MGKALKLDGAVTVTSTDGSDPSGQFSEVAKLTESLGLKNGVPMPDIELTSDAAVPVTFPAGIANVHVVVARTVGGEATLAATSSKGSLQAIPVKPLAVLMSTVTPFTALQLTRQAGVAVTVRLFIAEKS